MASADGRILHPFMNCHTVNEFYNRLSVIDDVCIHRGVARIYVKSEYLQRAALWEKSEVRKPDVCDRNDTHKQK